MDIDIKVIGTILAAVSFLLLVWCVKNFLSEKTSNPYLTTASIGWVITISCLFGLSMYLIFGDYCNSTNSKLSEYNNRIRDYIVGQANNPTTFTTSNGSSFILLPGVNEANNDEEKKEFIENMNCYVKEYNKSTLNFDILMQALITMSLTEESTTAEYLERIDLVYTDMINNFNVPEDYLLFNQLSLTSEEGIDKIVGVACLDMEEPNAMIKKAKVANMRNMWKGMKSRKGRTSRSKFF